MVPYKRIHRTIIDSSDSTSNMSAIKKTMEVGHELAEHNEYGSLLEHDGKQRENLSDVAETSFDLGLRECFYIFIVLLAVGMVAYSFVFEKWPIIDSLYFTVVMLTSAGYGDLSPSTPGGKIFTALFALAGIVMLGMVLGVVGSTLVEEQVAASQNVGKSKGKLERQSSIHDRYEESSFLSKISGHLPEFAFVLLGGIAVGMMEHWNLFDSFYYSVITATTIGFGDLAPKSEFARAVAIVYIPLAVGSTGYILGKVASSIVETKMADFNKKLWSYELTIKDIEALDEDNEGGGMCRGIS